MGKCTKSAVAQAILDALAIVGVILLAFLSAIFGLAKRS